MEKQPKDNDAWQYASFAGAERLQLELVGKKILSQRLDVLDQMVEFAQELHGGALAVSESHTSCGKPPR